MAGRMLADNSAQIVRREPAPGHLPLHNGAMPASQIAFLRNVERQSGRFRWRRWTIRLRPERRIGQQVGFIQTRDKCLEIRKKLCLLVPGVRGRQLCGKTLQGNRAIQTA